MADEVHIVPADPLWPVMFEREKTALLSSALGPQFVALEHVGSTAVPNLDAKPIIDILGGVRSMTDADALLKPLCALGWDMSPEFNATLADRRFLLRWPEGVRTHHLHLVEYGGASWRRYLTFRDTLRARLDLATQYQTLKYDLAVRHHTDREEYTAAKTEFIARVLSAV